MSTHILVLSIALSIWEKCEISSSWLHRLCRSAVFSIAKKNEENAEKLSLAPIALAKLEKNHGDVNKLTKKEIAAVLLVKYNVTMS